MDSHWQADSVPVVDLAVRVRNLGEVLIVATGLGDPRELAGVAAFIWRRIDGHRNVAALTDAVVDEYEIDPDVARRDVVELLADLSTADLIQQPTRRPQ